MEWDGPTATVTMPGEIDINNAGRIRDELLWLVNEGAATLIVDMSATTFCDSSGVSALVRAFKRAKAGGTEMRLVVDSPAVLRILTITGADRLITIYASAADATSS